MATTTMGTRYNDRMNWELAFVLSQALSGLLLAALCWAYARTSYQKLLIQSAIKDVERANAVAGNARRYALRLSQAARIGADRAVKAVPPATDEEDVSEAIEVLIAEETEESESLPSLGFLSNPRSMGDYARGVFEQTGEWPEDRKIKITGDMGI